MFHRILYVARVGPPAFPRFVICDSERRIWDGSTWATASRPLLYADQHFVSDDCADLQRAETLGKKCLCVVEVPLRAEVFSDRPLDPEQLQVWLQRHLSLDIDFTNGSGPTKDSLVLGVIDWPRYRELGGAT